MSRRALAKEMSEKFYMKQYQAHEMAEKVFESLKSLLRKKGKVIIHGFGSFTVYKGKKRKGPDTLKVRFRPSAQFLERLNNPKDSSFDFLVELEDELYRKPSKKNKKTQV